MKNKLTFFVSYCYTDLNSQLFEYFTSVLDEISDDNIEWVIDKKNLKVGDNLISFMDKIDKVDGVVLLLTPAYKLKVLEKSGNAYYEYNKIIERYKISEDRHNNFNFKLEYSDEDLKEINGIKYFQLVPVLFSGNVDSSVPNELKEIIFADVSKLRVFKNKNSINVSDKIEELKVKKQLRSICDVAVSKYLYYNPSFKYTWDEFIKILFKESKSEFYKDEFKEYIEHLLVKTDVFKKVRSQDVWFIVGRKGSGKSTITDVLPYIDKDKYLASIPIIAEEFDLHAVYNIFTANANYTPESNNLKYFQFGWELFIYLSCIYKLVEIDAKKKIRNVPPQSFNLLKKFIRNILAREHKTYSSDMNFLFIYSFSKLQEFVLGNGSESMSQSNTTSASSNTTQMPITIEDYKSYLIPFKIIEKFYEILSSTEKKILLTFDGLDTKFDYFRKESIRNNASDIKQRATFEFDWLNSLLLLILNQGANPRSETRILYKTLNYCITIPKDRFLEVRKVDRDTFRHHGRFYPLNWSGIELSIFLRKRLELLAGIKTNKNLLPQQRLDEILAQGIFSNIPNLITFEFNGKQYKMPLFFYVLRHTFWRPRDILFYYTKILTLSKELKFKRKEITVEKIRYIIRLTTIDVIKSEFINEFNTAFERIEDIITVFKNSKQILDFNNLSRLLYSVDIQSDYESTGFNIIRNKIDFLYQIGFLGFIVDPILKQRFHSINKYAFIFNEGYGVFEQLEELELKETLFCIHPIFCEKLKLDTAENEELVLLFDWEYLHTKEELRNIMQDL